MFEDGEADIEDWEDDEVEEKDGAVFPWEIYRSRCAT
jgi:hypothetical protein